MTHRDYYIYEHWRPDIGECFYVGKGRKYRSRNMHKRSWLHRVVQNQLRDKGLAVEIRFVMRNLTHDAAIDEEIKRIAFWRAAGADLVNFTDGGEGCSRKQSPEERAKRSAAMKGISFSDEHRRKLREAWKNRAPVTEETRRKQSCARKGRFTGELHPMWGRKHSPGTIEILRIKSSRPKTKETRARLSAANKGRIFSAEWRAKLSAAKRNLSPETRLRILEGQRRRRAREAALKDALAVYS